MLNLLYRINLKGRNYDSAETKTEDGYTFKFTRGSSYAGTRPALIIRGEAGIIEVSALRTGSEHIVRVKVDNSQYSYRLRYGFVANVPPKIRSLIVRADVWLRKNHKELTIQASKDKREAISKFS